MQKTIANNNVTTFLDDEIIIEINAAGTDKSGATPIFVQNNFKRVVLAVTRVDDNNKAIAFGQFATLGQIVEIHPIGGEVEVFADKFNTIRTTFLDGSTSFVTDRGVALRGITNAWSRIS